MDKKTVKYLLLFNFFISAAMLVENLLRGPIPGDPLAPLDNIILIPCLLVNMICSGIGFVYLAAKNDDLAHNKSQERTE